MTTLTWYWSRGAKAPHPKTVFGFPNDVLEVGDDRHFMEDGSPLPTLRGVTMSALIDLGFCPCCFEDLIDTPSSVIINARYCRICADRIRGDRKREEIYLRLAEVLKEIIDR